MNFAVHIPRRPTRVGEADARTAPGTAEVARSLGRGRRPLAEVRVEPQSTATRRASLAQVPGRQPASASSSASHWKRLRYALGVVPSTRAK